VGDDTDIAKSAGTASRLRAAEEFLMENPELKGVHSTASVRTMLAKAEIQAAAVELV
jgi:trehalose-6-phosphate synthase